MRKNLKYLLAPLFLLSLLFPQSLWAQGEPAPSIFSNPLAITLITLMLLLLIIIGVLANILLGSADLHNRKREKTKSSSAVLPSVFLLALLFSAPALFAQDATANATPAASANIGGMAPSTFYIMATVLFLELAVILVLLVNIRMLIRTEKERVTGPEAVAARLNRITWWDRFNKLKPVSQEAELDLGHEYDGIRELNNRLPPWWLYGFYLTIIFAAVYLWRFHVSHTGPSSKEEYETAVAKADQRIQEYLKKKGDAVDENTVKVLTNTADLSDGKAIFEKSCATCHKATGAGDVGPNLTDDYWLHGNNIKDIFKTIRYGFNAMPQWQNAYSNKQIAQVASYVKSLHGTNPANPKPPQGTLQKDEPAVTTPAADSTKVSKGVVKQ